MSRGTGLGSGQQKPMQNPGLGPKILHGSGSWPGLIIVIQAGLEEIDVKGWIFLIKTGVGGVPEAIGHLEGQLGGEGEVEAAAKLGSEVEGVGEGRAVDALGDQTGAPFNVRQNAGKKQGA